jgi:hypothetical protein
MGRINRTKLLDRQQDRRDARLFVIATEGKETEKQYFNMFNSSRIKVEVLPTGEDGKSAPQYVLDRLDGFREQYDLDADDMIKEAIERAKNLHPDPQEYWPTSIGSHIYRLVELICLITVNAE